MTFGSKRAILASNNLLRAIYLLRVVFAKLFVVAGRQCFDFPPLGLCNIYILNSPLFSMEILQRHKGHDVTNRNDVDFLSEILFLLFIPGTQSSKNMKISFHCVTFISRSAGVVIGVSDNVRFSFDKLSLDSWIPMLLISQYISIKASYSNFAFTIRHMKKSNSYCPSPTLPSLWQVGRNKD